MDFLVNERSLHGQYPNPGSFQAALRQILALRAAVQRAGHTVRCARSLTDAPVCPQQVLRQAVKTDPQLRPVVIAWLANHGPFWEDDRLHEGGEWFESRGQVVTDSSIADAAKGALLGAPRDLLSFRPSDWTLSPVTVEHLATDEQRTSVELNNFWEPEPLSQRLQALRQPLRSWRELVDRASADCPLLTLSEDVASALDGYPFIPAAAERFMVLLRTLNQLRDSFGPDGQLTAQGMRLYQDHFVGNNAWFTDSSDSEKREFKSELTFPDPANPGQRLLFGWHGKVRTEQMRMHFSFPIRHDQPVYVVYIGPKLTKR